MKASDIHREICSFSAVWETENGYGLNTHCLYPSGTSVPVFITVGQDTVFVSDGGSAVNELNSGGRFLTDHIKSKIKKDLKKEGLSFANEGIFLRNYKKEDIAAAVLLVANASRDVADWGLSNISLAQKRNFKEQLETLLVRKFSMRIEKNHSVIGKSNKSHRFDYLVKLKDENILLVDAVTPEPNSFNRSIVSNLDVREADNPHISQRIIYNDEFSWKAADLSLLRMAAPITAFSDTPSSIEHWLN